VIGTFTTRMYDSREDQILELPSGVHVVRNAFTNVGMNWMWMKMVGLMPDDLSQAHIVVGDSGATFTGGEERLVGTTISSAPMMEGFPQVTGTKILLRAEFGERDGIHEWAERGVIVPSGVLIDRAVADQGRKVLGAVWVVEAELELAGS